MAMVLADWPTRDADRFCLSLWATGDQSCQTEDKMEAVPTRARIGGLYWGGVNTHWACERFGLSRLTKAPVCEMKPAVSGSGARNRQSRGPTEAWTLLWVPKVGPWDSCV